MNHAPRLRSRLLASIATGGLVVGGALGGCGGNASGEDDRTGAGGSPGTGGAAGARTGGTSGTPKPLPACDLGTREDTCFTLEQLKHYVDQNGQLGNPDAPVENGPVDPNGCPIAERVTNTCCVSAKAGPWLEGQECCYRFCQGACCGRPFSIDGAARVASRQRRRDWLTELTPLVHDLDDATREQLADAWTDDGLMEHASVASFARFTLDLMAAGAPPELVAASQEASLDEVEHAKLCFAMASRLAGEPRGPGALDVSGALGDRALVRIAEDALIEGALGESIAALTARERAAVARDHQARATLEAIADDEERHAELAWRFLRWAIDARGAEIRTMVERRLRDARSQCAVTVAEGVETKDVGLWHDLGHLTDREALRIRERAWSEVIEPCAAELLSATRAA